MNGRHLFPVLVAVLIAAAAARGGIVTGVHVDLGSPANQLSVGKINDFSPTGFKMDGMQVTVKFSNGDSETAMWQGINGDEGHAVGTNFAWSLYEKHNTFFSTWDLTNNTSLRITRLTIQAGLQGNTVFDLQKNDFSLPGDDLVTPGGTNFNYEGTTDSERGWTFDALNIGTFAGTNNGGDLEVTATYRNAVKLDSASGPVGDLWTELDIEFGGPAAGLASWQNIVGGTAIDGVIFSFKADTDIIGEAEIDEPVPEPSSLFVMLGLGIYGAGSLVARRRACM